MDDEIAEMALQMEAYDKYRIFSKLMIFKRIEKVFRNSIMN